MQDLENLFRPRAIAIVGISSNPTTPRRDRFLTPLLDFGFEGQIYPINPKGGEISGLRILPSIKDIPGAVDYVIASIPAPFCPQLMRDCIAKGVKFVCSYASGFSETGEEEGIALEAELAQIAKSGGSRIIGPNCLGTYCPEGHISYRSEFPKESGPVGYLCQSGGNSIQLVQMVAPRGVRFSKVVSYGNACDLSECDFLQYLTYDPDTEIIALYIEGVKDGQRFINLLTEASKRKPVVLLKGGCSMAGAMAVSSHTGALAGNNAIWDALCKQLGIIRVHSLEELGDMLVTFLFMSPVRGRNMAIVGVGGGASVLATDDCESVGLAVPPLPLEIREELLKFTPKAGSSVRNPIDTQVILSEPNWFLDTVRIISSWKGIDLVIVLVGPIDVFPSYIGEQSMYGLMVKAMLEASIASAKPVAAVVQPGIHPEMYNDMFGAQQEFASAGFPVYPTMIRAAKAIDKFISYHQRKKLS